MAKGLSFQDGTLPIEFDQLAKLAWEDAPSRAGTRKTVRRGMAQELAAQGRSPSAAFSTAASSFQKACQFCCSSAGSLARDSAARTLAKSASSCQC